MIIVLGLFITLALLICGAIISSILEKREQAKRDNEFRTALAKLDSRFPPTSIYDKL